MLPGKLQTALERGPKVSEGYERGRGGGGGTERSAGGLDRLERLFPVLAACLGMNSLLVHGKQEMQ